MTSRFATFARAAALAAAAACVPLASQAGLFDDDEARRAILDLRQRIDVGDAANRKQIDELNGQVSVLRGSVLDLNNQLEQMRSDLARLRGQNEQLMRDISDAQRQQKDIVAGVDERMRRFEPQKVTLDGKEFLAEPDEKRQYEEALAAFRGGDFAAASTGFTAFQQRWPSSGFASAATFWLGNAHYAQRDYKQAINAYREVVRVAPESPRAPEALLAMANCQFELKDPKAARRTLEELVKGYPTSEAAAAGKERLASTR